jgi:hypothetical protein
MIARVQARRPSEEQPLSSSLLRLTRNTAFERRGRSYLNSGPSSAPALDWSWPILLQKSAVYHGACGSSVCGRKALEEKHRFLESTSNKTPGKESDFKPAALCRRQRLPKYFCNKIGPMQTSHLVAKPRYRR